jgi:adenine deaminase
MLTAAWHVQDMNGGIAVVLDGRVVASLALPLAGLMSNRDLFEVADAYKQIRAALETLGAERDIFMTLSFVQLAVIPSIRITDQGIVDVETQQLVDLWVG